MAKNDLIFRLPIYYSLSTTIYTHPLTWTILVSLGVTWSRARIADDLQVMILFEILHIEEMI